MFNCRNIFISLLFVFSFFFFLLFQPVVLFAESSSCEINNKDHCQSSETSSQYQDEQNDNCDKTIYFFYGEECGHCADLDRYLKNEILINHPEIVINRYEVWHNQENYQRMDELLSSRGVKERVVPTTIVNGQTFVGYGGDRITGVEIKKSIFDLYCIDEEVSKKSLNILFFKGIDIEKLSLPLVTLALGVIDGFNPCAMWALVALVTILIATKERKKIWLVGSVFLLSSWLIYYLFISLYLNTFIFLSFVAAIRYIVACVALIAGVIYLKNFFTFQPGVCKVTNISQQKTIIEKMKRLVRVKSVWLMIVGAIVLSFFVNIIEMICSIGLPVIYSQILASSNVSIFYKYLYLALYNTLYMADDIIVFILAAMTLKYINLSSKYERWMKLIGGLLIIALAFILVFFPNLLNS